MIVIVLLVPVTKLPIFQLGYEKEVPDGGVADTKEKPDGKRSFTTTEVAVEPATLLLATSVKITLLPIVGVALFTVFVRERSAQRRLDVPITV